MLSYARVITFVILLRGFHSIYNALKFPGHFIQVFRVLKLRSDVQQRMFDMRAFGNVLLRHVYDIRDIFASFSFFF